MPQPPRNEFYKTAPHNWYNDAVRLNPLNGAKLTPAERATLEARTQWMHNKTILLVGDSTDRFLSMYLCQLGLGGNLSMAPGGRHSSSYCHVDWLNFTAISWHVASLYETKPSWWMAKEMEFVSWEDRWNKFFMPSLVMGDFSSPVPQPRVRPDLIVMQSGLWDHNVFVLGKAGQERLEAKTEKEKTAVRPDFTRLLNYRELRYYLMRMDKVLGDLQKEFPDTPLLCRSLTQRTNGDQNAGVHQLDVAFAYACRRRDVEMMPFGRIVRGLIGIVDLFGDVVHFHEGPISSLYSNILFWYLNRASGGVEHRGKLVVKATDGPATTTKFSRCHNYCMLNYPS
ncbi:uncharacterized protein V1518DRAFT_377266 [Limtongia smithiae]|uniref:uncharacterized protein n=1 Tax=Limtongia smithiae TaxID=1125753 RepID=UPI0034CE1F77